MQRAAQEQQHTAREWRIHWRWHVWWNKMTAGRPGRVGRSAYEVDCPCDRQQGRFRKKKAFGCSCRRCRRDKAEEKYHRASSERTAQREFRGDGAD